MEKLLLAFVATALGVAESEVEAKLKDAEDASPLLELHKQKVKEQKETNFNDGYKKAEKKVKSDYEKSLKEAFGIESEKIGADLVEELKSTVTTTTPGEITEDAIKKHPLYLAKEKEVQTVAKNVEKEWKTKLTELEQAQAKKETFKVVEQRAIAEFEKLNPVLSPDPIKAARQRELLIKELAANGYQVDGENILTLNPDGTRKEDGHGNAYKFQDLVRETADKYFDFKVAEDRSSAGNTNQNPQATTKKFTGQMPKTQDDYFKIVNNEDIPIDQRLEVKEAWEKQTSNV